MNNQNINLSASQDRRAALDSDAYFNAEFGVKPFFLGPGEFSCCKGSEEMIVATVGSGMAVSIHERESSIGGMAYLLVPDCAVSVFPDMNAIQSGVMQKVFQPLEDCIEKMRQMGASGGNIRIRLMGGTDYAGDSMERGMKNYVFVREYLNRKGLVLMSEDIHGSYLRRIHFFPSTGRAVRRILRRKEDFASLQEEESGYQKRF